MISHSFHSSILRAYDIRGIYGKTLFDRDAFFIGKAFASFLHKSGKKKVAVASDARSSSPSLKTQLIKGLTESGIEVFDVGIGPTPMLYFSVYHLDLDAGIMVTGSHNPKDHNGLKMMLRERPFYGDDIQNLSKMVADLDFVDAEGSVKDVSVIDDYVERILLDCVIAHSRSALLDEVDQLKPKKKLKIAWDAGNGAAGDIMKKLSKRISAENILLFEEMDGNFPNHHPDPTVPENLEDLRKKVLEENCDIGIAFDGDADRIGVIDDSGEILWGDQLMILYAREILKDKPGSTIIADVKASNILFSEIKKAGGVPIMWKTGHSLIKAKMKETKAVLAGEMSGHIFFADKYYGFDDGLYAAIRIINIVANSPISLSEIRKSLPKTFSTQEIRIECSEEKKFKIVEKIKQNLQKAGANFIDVDGVRVNTESGWWLLRASNTQSVLVARCEADSRENLEKLQKDLEQNLSNVSLF